MSLLYKPESDIKYEAHITQKDGQITLLFSCDGGKFGTDEILDEHTFNAKELLEILQRNEQEMKNINYQIQIKKAAQQENLWQWVLGFWIAIVIIIAIIFALGYLFRFFGYIIENLF